MNKYIVRRVLFVLIVVVGIWMGFALQARWFTEEAPLNMIALSVQEVIVDEVKTEVKPFYDREKGRVYFEVKEESYQNAWLLERDWMTSAILEDGEERSYYPEKWEPKVMGEFQREGRLWFPKLDPNTDEFRLILFGVNEIIMNWDKLKPDTIQSTASR